MKTVHTDDHRLHDARNELSFGEFVPMHEMPRRVEIIIARVREAGLGPVLPPRDFGLDPILRVHDAGLVRFLETAHEDWRKCHGGTEAIPISWLARGMRGVVPESIHGKLAYYALDACTPITATTWDAVRASANVALTGQGLVAGGEGAAFALCRPPGHHAAKDLYGGYCFLNNAAIAAQAFRDGGAARVAILDVDYHHGNGTQAIFYDRADVLFASLHGHPAQEYPYFLGYEEEKGEGAGEGFNLNYPLRHGTGWAVYEPALVDALRQIEAYGPDVLVVSLGVDTYKADPISHFKLESEHYLRIGERIAGLRAPTLFVMEGGYAVEEIGINAVNVLTGFEGAARG